MDSYSMLRTLTIDDVVKKTKLPRRLILQWLADGEIPGYVEQPLGLGQAQLDLTVLDQTYNENSDNVRMYVHSSEPDTFEDWGRKVSLNQVLIKTDELDRYIQRSLTQKLDILKPDFTNLKYGMTQFILNQDQAKIVSLLYEARKRGAPTMSQEEIVLEANINRGEERVDKVLRSTKNPILGVLVLRGDKPATYKIAPFVTE